MPAKGIPGVTHAERTGWKNHLEHGEARRSPEQGQHWNIVFWFDEEMTNAAALQGGHRGATKLRAKRNSQTAEPRHLVGHGPGREPRA